MDMFRIISFEQHKHSVLRDKCFNLWNTDEDETDNYYTIIIGPNGTGKSYLLNGILEVFNELVLLKKTNSYKIKRSFTLEYNLNGSIFKIIKKDRFFELKKDKRPIHPEQLELPAKWLASSVTINDKFPMLNYLTKKKIKQYHYLGVRSASNNAFIGKITNNTVLYLIEALKKGKINKLFKVYETLSLNPEIEIIFSGANMLKLEKEEGKYSLYKKSARILDAHRDFIKKNKNAVNFRTDTYKKYLLIDSVDERIYHFMIENRTSFEKNSKGAIQLSYKINLNHPESIFELLRDWDTLSIMMDLELVKITKYLITKDCPFKYEEASSGESHLITSLHGIIANIEDNSIVAIDEPEVSLHPNWQIEYFDILKSIIDEYKGVHVLIATHSNLLVSSLKNEESRIISLKRNKDTRELELDELDYETFGWDPERILYKIFGLVTQRNKFFENDLRILIDLISNKDSDLQKVIELRNNLQKFILTDIEDPLTIIISRTNKYLENRYA
jgi:predicted ATPase